MLVERVDSLDELRPEWSSFAERRGGIFATWEWSRTWWRHYGSGRELLLHVCRSTDGQLLSVLPLYVWRPRWPRVIRFLGHGPGDELGPLHVPGGGSVAASALRAALDVLRWDVFAGEQLPGDEAWSNLLGAPTWRREACPALHVPAGGWDEYLASRSSNFREQLARRRRALEDGGALGFRLADETSLDRDLDTLFALHRARWGSRESDFADTPFHRELAHTALKRGWLRLWLLELDGLPLAAWHGFQVGEIASYYQAGRDPAYERLSVGFVLLAHSLREAIAEGASEYRFGRGARDSSIGSQARIRESRPSRWPVGRSVARRSHVAGPSNTCVDFGEDGAARSAIEHLHAVVVLGRGARRPRRLHGPRERDQYAPCPLTSAHAVLPSTAKSSFSDQPRTYAMSRRTRSS